MIQKTQMKSTFDCVIIGAGISGMTAAIYLKRANMNVLIIEKDVPGGQINKTSVVENYPGFKSIDGPSLVMNIYNQINELEIPIKYGKVIDIIDNYYKEIILSNEIIYTKGIIIATGRTSNLLNLENEKELIGKGISFCALCDGSFFRNKDVCVVGGGNSALEESLYLSKLCKKVTIINRSNELRASQILIDQVKQTENIKILYNSTVTKINKDNILSSIEINGKETLCDGLFIYIGSTPNISFANNLNLNIENNYINVDSNMRTNRNLIYACGDVIKKDVYQIVTAASDGAIAATSFERDYKRS